ncbi:MAG: hypothetical protein ABI672_21740 [Vicinamibacteria bacterium]
MSPHRHLSSEDICERVLEGLPTPEIDGCAQCEGEAASFAQVFGGLRRADTELVSTTDWDDLILRSRIRDAVSKETAHAPSIFDRLMIFRPVFAAALVAVMVLIAWAPLSRFAEPDLSPSANAKQTGMTSPASHLRIPAWTPLPAESEDQGLAVLAEWTPNEDELTVARCRAACLGGMTNHEESLILAASNAASVMPLPGASPL